MKAVRYNRPRKDFQRVLRVKDLDQLGIEHGPLPGSLVWDQSNKFTIVMSDKLSDSLVAKLPNEFTAFDFDEDDESLAVDSMTSSSASGESQGDPDDSVDDLDDDDESSTDDDGQDD